ncbi:MAG TPA: AsmA-like C-terminal region-containing protein [Candidatus Acidoferrales bacterium]|nr:AsmA-like C-terminal region-containing protein [Candidatus Acidoferrales bacterium]
MASVSRAEPVSQAPSRLRRWSRWPRWILLLLFLLWILSEGVSLAIQHTRLQRKLTARLEAAFGRPVAVAGYHFSLWDGPVLEARSVTVAEDPRFGHEYFLRSESLAVRLRWQSLLRGHIRLGSLSLTRPSLNLVRDASGDWNLAEWLPRPAGMPGTNTFVGPRAPPPLAPRFRRIDVDGGRINFKRGDEKLPFAFVGVTGTVETDQPGRWRMDLAATPWRAAVAVQQAGTIHVSGELGGTSSRLRPAALNVFWTAASISDVLRLAGGDDHGVRGALGLAIYARTQDRDDGWAIRGRAELRQIHRWDLALQPDDPSVNLIVRTEWRPEASSVAVTDAALESPRSNAHASGSFAWSRPAPGESQTSPPVQVKISSAQVDLADLLAWLRAFRPGVAADASVRGLATVRGEISGWPPRIVDASVQSDGLALSGAGLRRPAHLGPVQLHYVRGLVSLPPVSLSFGAPEDVLRFESSAKPGKTISNAMRISGNISDARDALAAAAALGWHLYPGWDVSGPVRADLRWQGAQYPWQAPPVGFIDWGAGPGVAILRAPFLNQPISGINALTIWKPGARHIALASAQAFGAHWSGAFDRLDAGGGWQFVLAADHIAAADLDRWLNPAWRQSFLDRILPFLNSRPLTGAAPANLRASGRLTLDRFVLAPFSATKLQGDLSVNGRRVEFANASGQFYGGAIAGSFRASLDPAQGYHADINFARVNVDSLVAAAPSLTGVTAASATGQISFDARGATRSALVASLTCRGRAQLQSPELPNLSVWKSLGVRPQNSGSTRFSTGAAVFSCAQRKINLRSLTLQTTAGASAQASGTIGFDRNLDLRWQIRPALPGRAETSDLTFRLAGSLAAPQVLPIESPPRGRAR